MIGAIRIFLVVAAMIALSLSLIPVQYLLLKMKNGWKRRLPNFFHRVVACLFGFRIRTVGQMHEGRPLLLVANHTSWSDIVVLSAVGPVSFIAKSEVRDWPVFGMFAVLQRTVFVERERRGKTGEQTSEIARRLATDDAMVLFAEGTTSDGNRVLPFKTALSARRMPRSRKRTFPKSSFSRSPLPIRAFTAWRWAGISARSPHGRAMSS